MTVARPYHGNCVICGISIEKRWSGGRKPMYCGRGKCANAAFHFGPPRLCACGCGVEFSPKITALSRTWQHQKFATAECRHKHNLAKKRETRARKREIVKTAVQITVRRISYDDDTYALRTERLVQRIPVVRLGIFGL